MPYKSIKDINPAIKGMSPVPTLAQANLIAGWADSIKERRGDVNPWAVAISLFTRKHHTEKGKWVKDKTSKASAGAADEFLNLIEGLEEVGLQLVRHFPPLAQPYYYDDQPPMTAGEPAYVVDLFTELPKVNGKPDFGQPFRILPAGTIHRYGKRTVTVDDIEQFADNWKHRTERGIRRSRVVIDTEHESGGIGWYTDIFSQGGDGLWAKIALSPNGRKLLDTRDFYFFSPSVAWSSKDRVTGEVVKNQIVGGALTNFPVFGDDTALPTMGYSEAALRRIHDLYHDSDQRSKIEHLFQKGADPMTVDFTETDRSMLQKISETVTTFGGLITRKGGNPPVVDKKKAKEEEPVKIVPVEVTPEKFAEMQGELAKLAETLETLSTERDELKKKVATGETQLAAETYTRVLQDMKAIAEGFTHLALPLELAKDAPKGSQTAQEHLAWLQAADGSDGRLHWAFFNEVFRSANAALAEVALYTEIGRSRTGELSEDALLDQKARRYATEHKVTYMAALKAIMAGAEPTAAA